MELEKKKNFIINFLYLIIICLIVYLMFQYALPIFAPFIFAFTIAFSLQKPARFLSGLTRIKKSWISLLLVLVFYSTIGLFLFFLGFKIFRSLSEMVSILPYIYTTFIEPVFTSIFGNFKNSITKLDPAIVSALSDFLDQFLKSIGQLVSNLSVNAVTFISNFAASLPGLLIRILLMVISTFFIAADYDKLMRFVIRQFSDKGGKLVLSIKEYLVGTLLVCIRSYLLIISITFIELSIGFLIIGIDHPILIALMIAIFDILPVLGTGGIMIPWVIITALQGNYTLALGLLAIYVVVTIIRNVIEPKIVGSQIGLHPVITLMSMFVGVQFFGILGLFGFPVTLSLLRYLNNSGAIKLFK